MTAARIPYGKALRPLRSSFFVLRSFFPPQIMPSGPLREVGAGGAWRETSGNPGHPKPNHPSIKQMAKDSPRIRGTTPQIQQAARHLRQNLTPAEAKLWSVLQKRQQNGLKFRCQHPLGRFIVDFYCPTYKLIIEIDGPIHKQQQHYDQARTEQLQAFGYRVLRLTNQQVLDDLTTALTLIKTAIKTLSPPEYALRAAARGGG